MDAALFPALVHRGCRGRSARPGPRRRGALASSAIWHQRDPPDPDHAFTSVPLTSPGPPRLGHRLDGPAPSVNVGRVPTATSTSGSATRHRQQLVAEAVEQLEPLVAGQRAHASSAVRRPLPGDCSRRPAPLAMAWALGGSAMPPDHLPAVRNPSASPSGRPPAARAPLYWIVPAPTAARTPCRARRRHRRQAAQPRARPARRRHARRSAPQEGTASPRASPREWRGLLRVAHA